MTLTEMTLAGSLLILFTIVVRGLLIHRMPKGALEALWALSAARLLIPFCLPCGASVFAWLQAKRPVESVEPQTTVVMGSQAVQAPAAEVPARTAVAAQFTLPAEVWIWLIGMTVCVLAFAAMYFASLRRFREACPCEFGEAWLRNHPMRRKVRILQTDRISAPLTYGLLRPVILLPKALEAGAGDLNWILCHEWMHVRRMDALRKFLLAMIACVHWFNPLVWAMFILANRDIEMACDERVLRMNGGDNRRAYAMALIRMEAEKSRPAPMCSHFAKNAIEERIIGIMKMEKCGLLAIVLAALLVLSAGAAFATSAPEGNPAEVTSVVEGGSAEMTKEDYQEYYAQYEPYGLTWNEQDQRLYYQGKKVRHFEDMYPVNDEGGMAGTIMTLDGGEVDVYAIRDLTGPIVRNEDGSFDPSGTLLGLRASTQEEFDAFTEKAIQNYWNEMNPDTPLEWWTEEGFEAWLNANRDQIGPEVAAEYEKTLQFIRDGGRVSKSGWETGDVMMVSPSGEIQYSVSYPEYTPESDVEWWTADEYAAWLEKEKAELQALVGTDARAWTPSTGWFTWDQQKVDETIAQYEETLDFIRKGGKVGRCNDGSVIMSGAECSTVIEQGCEVVEHDDHHSHGMIAGYSIAEDDAVEAPSEGTLPPEMFAEYAPYGLTVENNALYFQGQRVRSFNDTYQMNWRTISCEHNDPYGTINIRAVRENGVLKGLEILP